MTMIALSPEQAKAALHVEYQRKMAELDAIGRAQADAIAAAAHLDSSLGGQAAVQAQRQAETDRFGAEFAEPLRAEFEAINLEAQALNAIDDECVAALKANAQKRKALAGKIVVISRDAGLRCQRLGLTPSRKAVAEGEFSKLARDLWSELYQNSAVWQRPETVAHVTSNYAFREAEAALMFPAQDEPTPAPPLQTKTPPPQRPPAPPVTTAAPAKRTGYSVEQWVNDYVTVGSGRTMALTALDHYNKHSELYGFSVISSVKFAAEMELLMIENHRINRGSVYTMILR